MKKIAYLFVAAMAVLSFTGCKKKSASAEAMAKMEGFKKDMCACKDKACAEGVETKMNEWMKSMMDKAGKEKEKPSAEEEKKGTELMNDYQKCKTTAMGPMTPPGGDGSAAPTPPPADDKKMDEKKDDKAAAPADEKKDDKAAAPADEKKDDKKM